MSILNVENLSVSFRTSTAQVNVVDRISFSVHPGETLGIVGESGSGKSVTSLALMGLLPENATIKADCMSFMNFDLLRLSELEKQSLRGGDVAMIFQDPMTSLNPCFTVGFQLMEALQAHQEHLNKNQRFEKSIGLLRNVGISSPEVRMKAYPHQLSGGMCQRIMIAMALACKPKLLIADEPTTALDVTIQAQILELLDELIKTENMSLILISHDIGVIAQHTDRVLVMYAGQIVEQGITEQVIDHPAHPYTRALLDSLPANRTEGQHRTRLYSIPGMVPDLVNRPSGCQLHPRCSRVQERCKSEFPELNTVPDHRKVRCFFPLGPYLPGKDVEL